MLPYDEGCIESRVVLEEVEAVSPQTTSRAMPRLNIGQKLEYAGAVAGTTSLGRGSRSEASSAIEGAPEDHAAEGTVLSLLLPADNHPADQAALRTST